MFDQTPDPAAPGRRVLWPTLLAVVALVTARGEGGTGTHWAFQPIRKPTVPAVPESGVLSPIDALVSAGLAEKGLAPSPQADRETLIRRAYFNLIGVPPSAQEVESFVGDPAADSFPRLIDRLLADQRFGERWARYWLDVARYADSKGYVFQEERRYAYSYTYRDWVVAAFNDDLPFDRFVTAQLAADLTLAREDPKHFAAMGFLTLGRRFLNNEPDIIDDRLDVTIRGLMGLTIGCARCHDHKFDPIPMADYYSLYGVFASSEEPGEKPLLGAPPRTAGYLEFEAELARRETAAKDYFEKKKRALFEAARIEPYLQLSADAWEMPAEEMRSLAKKRQLYPSVAVRWRNHLRELGPNHPVTSPWFLGRTLGEGSDFAATLQCALAGFSPVPVNRHVLETLQNTPPSSTAELNKALAGLLARHSAGQPIDDPSGEALRQVVMAPALITGLESRTLTRDFSVAERDEARRLRNKVEELKATSESAPARGMTMVDKSQPVEPRIFKRGDARSPGDTVARQFLSCLQPDRKPFTRGSGRLELAEAITDPKNPLTARVFVNRAWGWLTGQSLIDSPSDFGVRTPPAEQAALLDYLAGSFIEHRWSVKHLIREILLSATWQQRSDAIAVDAPPTAAPLAPAGLTPVVAPAARPSPASIDPENRLVWRMNRRRRDFESFRDSLLDVAGRLDPQMGGRAIDLDDPRGRRRTIYGFIDRQNLPGLFRSFDFASPDQHAPRRFQTTVPQQALFALNNPFVLEQARSLAAQPASSPDDRVRSLYRAVLSRPPQPAESASALEFVRTWTPSQTASAWEYGFGSLDPASGRTEFRRLNWFGQDHWSGSDRLPDPITGWVFWRRDGGHPGATASQSAILRWHSPGPAILRLQAELKRPEPSGDGIRLRITSSIRGMMGEWHAAPGGSAPVRIDRFEVAKDEIIDFVVDSVGTEHSDGFSFAPQLIDVTSGRKLASTVDDWAPPALDPWTALAQVLLASNEFMFVD